MSQQKQGQKQERATVLVVEDDERVRKLVSLSLERLGYQVLDAADGGAAERVVADHEGEIALMLIDLVLPDTDGRALSRRLRAKERGAEVLLVTGQSEDVLEEIVEREGGLHFLSKPFDRDELAAKIRLILSGGERA